MGAAASHANLRKIHQWHRKRHQGTARLPNQHLTLRRTVLGMRRSGVHRGGMVFSTTKSLVSALRDRRISAVELVDHAIARIDEVDARLNAVVVRDFERARIAAKAADVALARGQPGALLGVPMTVKEAFNVAGLPTTWGIPGTDTIKVSEDAVAVARLKAAGAIVIGKTNVPTNLADWQTCNPVYGVTNNPWDVGRSPGGSSGGSAVALAAGYVSLELGSDLSGSLRVPAHCCGVFAHKPTHGLVPMRGSAPPGTPVLIGAPDIDFAVAGPMARSAQDLGLAIGVLAGPDVASATGYRLALPPPRHTRLSDFRVLVLERHPMLPTSSGIRQAVHRFAEGLIAVGCKVDRQGTKVPDLLLVASTFTKMLMSFFGADMPAAAYQGAQMGASALDVSDDSPASSQLRGLVMTHRDWILADRVRSAVADQWRQLFRDWDVVICPVLPTEAIVHDHTEMNERFIVVDGAPVPYLVQGVWTSAATFSGLPATSMPIGLSGNGLPLGVQIVGPHLEDHTTITFADLAEREFGGFVPPPALAS